MKQIFPLLPAIALAEVGLPAIALPPAKPWRAWATAGFLTLPFLAFGQTEKPAFAEATAVTRAVVVGISDYQHPDIPDLRFADRDAEAFVQWLRSPAGGSLPDDNVQLLLNKDATRAQFAAKLDWLIEKSREEDLAIIYFSGHGDVDTKKFGQEGYLLCWDTPSESYMAGAYPLYFLRIVVSTLSLEKKAKVVVITDACHSGKLAGSSIGGAQFTNANLAQQFASEVKILSCQPDEYSIEGEQWGGGRGAFSYHLVDGLYGMADNNTDEQVTLSEIDRYLEDHVTKEVAPMEQTPMIVGDKKERLSAVIPELLAQWKQGKAGQPAQFKSVENRGLEDEVLAKVDSSIRALYYAFKKAVKDKVFFSVPTEAGEPAEACADVYYERLIQVPELQPLYGWMGRNYAAALQDEAQQYINLWMNSEIQGIGPNAIYARAPQYLARAASILGESHYFYNDLKAKEFFFRAGAIALQFKAKDSSEVNELLRVGYGYNNQLPVLYAMEAYYVRKCLHDFPRAEKLYLKAIELAPNWAFEYCYLGYCYAEWPGGGGSPTVILGNKEKARECWEKAIELKPNFCNAYSGLATYFAQEGDIAKAKMLAEEGSRYGCIAGIFLDSLLKSGDYETAVELVEKLLPNVPDSMYMQGWQFWPCSYAHLLSYDKKKYLEVSQKTADNFVEKKDKSISTTFYTNELGYLAVCQDQYFLLGNFEEAKRYFEKIKNLPDKLIQSPENKYSLMESIYTSGLISYIQSDYVEANRLFYECISLDSTSAAFQYIETKPFYGLALVAYKNKDFLAADKWLKKELDVTIDFDKNLYLFTASTIHLAIVCGLKEESLLIFSKAAERFPTNAAMPYHQGGIQHNLLDRPDLAIPCYQECLKRNGTFKVAYHALAKAYLQTGNKKAAFEWLERGLQKGYISRRQLDNDPVWEKMRGKKRFRGLMKEYFPDKAKD